MNATTAPERPRLLWANVLMFALTLAAALIVVPWYGFTQGYSLAAWVWFAVLLYANGLAITGGYHRLWSHRTYDAHWLIRLVYLFFGTMALQNSVLVWCSGHREHHQHTDDDDRDPYSAGRGLWFSHIGWMLRRYPSGDFAELVGNDQHAELVGQRHGSEVSQYFVRFMRRQYGSRFIKDEHSVLQRELLENFHFLLLTRRQ